jgi:hypothetical protein
MKNANNEIEITKHRHVKYFDYALLLFFFSQLLFIEDIFFFFFLFINLQVEHTLDKCYNEP